MNLPTLNRELRILGGLVPGGRGASQALFNVKRLQRGLVAGLSTPAGMATMASLVVLLAAEVATIRRKMELQDQRYRDLLSRYDSDMTREEYITVRNRSKDWSFKWMTQLFGGIRG